MSRKRQIVASAVNLVEAAQVSARLRDVSARGPRVEGAPPWYRIEVNVGAASVWIYDEIGEWGVSALDFVAELRAVHAPAIVVHINSPGGSIFDGFAIYNALLNHPARVTTRVEGVAASAASFIAQAGDEIVADEASTMMVHGGSGICIGKAADMREMADLLDKLDGQMAAIYAQRTERPTAEWLEQMPTDRWYTSDEAHAAGLVDRIERRPSGETPPPPDGSASPSVVAEADPFDFAAAVGAASSADNPQTASAGERGDPLDFTMITG